jgi:hypothetical protein
MEHQVFQIMTAVSAQRESKAAKTEFKRSRSSLSGTRHFAWQLSDCSSAPTLFSVIPQEAIFKQRHPSVSAWKQTRKKGRLEMDQSAKSTVKMAHGTLNRRSRPKNVSTPCQSVRQRARG